MTNANYSDSDLVFRLVDGTKEGTFFPISTQKCLLGQSYEESGEENGHCAIVRGPNGASIKGFGAEVVVNGQPIESQWLSEGDQIEIGEAKLEVVQLGQYLVPEAELVANDQPQPTHESETAQPSATDSPETAAFNNASTADAETSEQTESIYSPLNAPEAVDDPEPIQESTGQPQTATEQSDSRAIAQDLRLEKAFASLGDKETTVQQPEQVENPHRDDAAELAAETRLREVFTQHLHDHADEIVYDREEDKTLKSEPVENESVTQLLARMQAKGQLKGYKSEDDENDTLQSPQPEDVTSRVEPTQAFQPSQKSTSQVATIVEEDDEASVQDYMNRLLGRMGPAVAPESNVAATNVTIEETQIPTRSPSVEVVDLLTPSEYKPSKRAPEANKNLDAMRELANQTNRVAIQKSRSRQAKAFAFTNFGLMSLGGALGGYLIYNAAGTADYLMWTGGAVLGISLFLGGAGIKALISKK